MGQDKRLLVFRLGVDGRDVVFVGIADNLEEKETRVVDLLRTGRTGLKWVEPKEELSQLSTESEDVSCLRTSLAAVKDGAVSPQRTDSSNQQDSNQRCKHSP